MSYFDVQGYKYYIEKDIRPGSNKKYVAIPLFTEHKPIYFGDKRYQHFYDQIGEFSYLNHLDTRRKINYHKRHSAISKKLNGKIIKAIDDPLSPAFLSYYLLW